MYAFNWIAASIVIITLIYISFVLTLADWFSALRKGQAVTLLPERGGRKWPLWTQVVIIVIGMALCVPLFYFGWIPLYNVPSNTALTLGMIGLLLYLAGFIFVLWARRTLGKYWGLSTSLDVKLLNEHQIIQSGPYAFVRHPMYFGWWVAMLGLTLLYPVWALFILFASTLISFAGRARREEIALAERFGSGWVEYKKHTKFIIPFIY
ncbi:MAG: isoprenylcysteine carboxylmethyltransferase family protein [Chloroflexi bacterium]|nr:isoprenylcysteine carboxylmethyltransferase family protein [Chloroflexota bacterium]